MIETEYPELVDVPFVFRDRGTAIPADRRPAWRIALVCLLLSNCSRGRKSSIERLHILDWAIRNTDGRRQLLAFLRQESTDRGVIVRYDPALLRAVHFAAAEDYLKINGKSIQLATAGVALSDELSSSTDVFENERTFMEELGQSFLEQHIKEFLAGKGA